MSIESQVSVNGRMAMVWRDVLAQLQSGERGCQAVPVSSRISRPKNSPVRHYLAGKYSGLYLTARQRDVLQLFLQDRSASKIARQLRLSERTIEDYSRVLRAKFHCATKKELVHRLREEGADKAILQLH